MKKSKKIFIFVCLFSSLLLSSCNQNDLSLYDFIYESLEEYLLTGIQADNLLVITDEKEKMNYQLLKENYYFTFEVVRNKNPNTEERKIINKTFNNFAFVQNDTIFIKEMISKNTAPIPLYLSLYREGELVIQENADKGLCLSDNLYQFPGKYILTLTFQTNNIIQEDCFQIEIF